MKNIAIIGGGASGLMAAITASENKQNQIFLIEHNDKVGRKILVTGNGRCNITNSNLSQKHYYSDDQQFVTKVLSNFDNNSTLSFFENIGLKTKCKNGYYYPYSMQAETVVDFLSLASKEDNINVILNSHVYDIDCQDNKFLVKYSNSINNKKSSKCFDDVIIATGSNAGSTKGSDGSGYDLLKKTGHKISPILPALVSVNVNFANCYKEFFKTVKGVRTEIKSNIEINNKIIKSSFGELQLTEYGLSGIVIFELSSLISKAIYNKKQVNILIDFLPNFTIEELINRVENVKEKNHIQLCIYDYLCGYLNKNLVKGILTCFNKLKDVITKDNTKIAFDELVKNIDNNRLISLFQFIKNFKVCIKSVNDFTKAQVCTGGVLTSEINPFTMESNKFRGLYITGELINVDGICGGYNLQWAWSTGYLAGKSVSK